MPDPARYRGEGLDRLVTIAARTFPNQPAIVTPNGVTTTFATLDARVSRCAGALRLLGGTSVAVASALDPEFAVAYFGAVRAGYRVTPLNPLLREAELTHVLHTCAAQIAVITPEVYTRLSSIRDALPELAHVILLSGDSVEDLPILADTIAGADPTDPTPTSPDDIACAQFTSGTTGSAKAVLLTHQNLSVNAQQVAAAHGLSADTVTLNHLPTYHPMHLNSALAAGATQVLCPDPDPVAALAMADRYGVTHYYSLPVRLIRLAEDRRLAQLQPKSLSVVLSGGSALPPTAAHRLAEQLGVPVVQGYGLAETAPLTHSDLIDDPAPGSVGPPVAGTECRVVEITTRRPVACGTPGEVQVRGPQLMAGYLDPTDPAHPVPGTEADGWFSTGDIGYLDSHSRLFLVDRLKDVFKYDNWLVSPSMIEQVLVGHPAVRDCVVADRPDARHGAVACAFVVADGPHRPSPHELTAYVNDRVPYYQHLAEIRLVPMIQRSGNGKVLRRRLREELAAGTSTILEVEEPSWSR
jgi:long-chain acyl-CoA synthetase